MLNIRVLLVIAATVVAGSGCAAMSMGEEEFSCPGQPRGVLCVGPTEAYELTHSRDSLEDMMVDPETHDCMNGECRPNAIAAKRDGEAEQAAAGSAVSPNAPSGAAYQNDVEYTYAPRSEQRQYDGEMEEATVIAQVGAGRPASAVKASTEQGQLEQYSNAPVAPAPEPLAVLKAPEVMRILVAAWEDEQGDLNMPGYVYVELNPRQWITGHQANARPSRTVPFQVIQDAQNTERKQQAAGKGVDSLGVIQAPRD